jgi:rubredoxin-NAD+ reductase
MAQPEQSQALLQAWQGLPLQFEGGVSVRQALRQSKDLLQVRSADGRVFVGRILVSAVGLGTPSRLALQAGLRYDHGIVVSAQFLDTGVPQVHALGDCISIEGRPQRFIEPIHRQARLIADRICGLAVEPYDPRPPAVRVKTSSLPLTLAA